MSEREPEQQPPIEERVGAAIGRTAGMVLRVPLHLIGHGALLIGQIVPRRHPSPGEQPGLDLSVPPPPPPDTGAMAPRVTIIDYGPALHEVRELADPAQLPEPPPPGSVRWLNVERLELGTVTHLARTFGLHPLAAEDVLHTPQRPKFELYGDTGFIVCRMVRTAEGHLVDEQVSMFVREGLVITFQQIEGDVWNRIRSRLGQESSALRGRGAGYLAYALLDAIVDHGFPVLEHYGDRLTALEEELLDDPHPQIARRIHGIRRELVILRRILWPMRDMIDGLRSEAPDWLWSDAAYMRDVHDHMVRVIELLETFREMANGLNELYLGQQSHKMNEIMKVLTVVTSVFIPLSFLAGVWGMNFTQMPELGWRHGYLLAWGAFASIGLGLLAYFRRRGWL